MSQPSGFVPKLTQFVKNILRSVWATLGDVRGVALVYALLVLLLLVLIQPIVTFLQQTAESPLLVAGAFLYYSLYIGFVTLLSLVAATLFCAFRFGRPSSEAESDKIKNWLWTPPYIWKAFAYAFGAGLTAYVLVKVAGALSATTVYIPILTVMGVVVWFVWREPGRRSQNPAPNNRANAQSAADGGAAKVVEANVQPNPSLVYAWSRLLAFDRASTNQKTMYKRLRTIIIGLNVLATLFAVISAKIDPANGDAALLRLVLVIIPLISLGVFNYAQRYASTVWIEFRMRAEEIRSEVYQYWMKAGLYVEDAGRDSNLQTRVDEICESVQRLPIFTPYLKTTYTEKSLPAIARAQTGEENIFGTIDVQQYVERRINSQRNWYVRRVQTDHSQARTGFIMIQAVIFAGGVFAAFDLGFLVAITASLSVAIALYSDLNGYGATYSVYHRTADELDQRLTKWKIQQATQPEIVNDVERILREERTEWYRTTTEMQSKVTQSLQGILSLAPASETAEQKQTRLVAMGRQAVIDYLANSKDKAIKSWGEIIQQEPKYKELEWVATELGFGKQAPFGEAITDLIENSKASSEPDTPPPAENGEAG